MSGFPERKILNSAQIANLLIGIKNDGNNFYIYIYLDPRKPGKFCYGRYRFDYEPFYVGKGQKRRCIVSQGRNRFLDRKIKKIGKIIVTIYKSNLAEEKAFELEKRLIARIGRIDLKKGPLCNLTDGGEGGSNPSKETRRLLSDAKKGKSPGNKGKHLSEETKQKLRVYFTKHPSRKKGWIPSEKWMEARRNHRHSEETKRKMSESHKKKIREED